MEKKNSKTDQNDFPFLVLILFSPGETGVNPRKDRKAQCKARLISCFYLHEPGGFVGVQGENPWPCGKNFKKGL
jgi:hypothetical protein